MDSFVIFVKRKCTYVHIMDQLTVYAKKANNMMNLQQIR